MVAKALRINAAELLREPGTRRRVDAQLALADVDAVDGRLAGDVAVDVTLESTLDTVEVAGTLTVDWSDTCRRCLRAARRLPGHRRRRAVRGRRPGRLPDRARPDRPGADGPRERLARRARRAAVPGGLPGSVPDVRRRSQRRHGATAPRPRATSAGQFSTCSAPTTDPVEYVVPACPAPRTRVAARTRREAIGSRPASLEQPFIPAGEHDGRSQAEDVEVEVPQPSRRRLEALGPLAQHVPALRRGQAAAHRVPDLRLVQGPRGRRRQHLIMAFPGHAGRCWPLPRWRSLARITRR